MKWVLTHLGHSDYGKPEAIGILVAGGIIGLFVPQLAPFILLYIFYRLVRLTVFTPLRQLGMPTRTILVALGVVSLNTILGFALWAVKLPINASVLVVVYALLAASLLIIKPATADRQPEVWIQKREVFALAFALVLFFVVASPLLIKNSSINPIPVTRTIAYGGDNLSHIEFIQAIGRQQGYVQGNYRDLEKVLTAKLIPYPEGWHLNVSLIKDTAERVTSTFSVNQFVNLYQIMCAAGLALLAYLFIIVGYSIQATQRNTSRLTRYLSLGSLAALLFTGPFFTFLAIGFQTQIAALAMFLAEILLLLQLIEQKDRTNQWRLLYAAILIASGIAYVWFFLWPIALAAVAFFAIEIIGINSKKALLRGFKLLAGAALLACFGAGQLLFQILFAPQSPTINEPGFILEPNTFYLLSLLLVTAVCVLYLYRNKHVRMFAQITGACAVFSLCVLAYQLFEVAQPRYFYYKSTFTFVLLSTLIVASLLSESLHSGLKAMQPNRLKYVAAAGLLAIAAASSLITVTSKEFRLYAKRNAYGMSAELTDAILTITRDHPNEAHQVVAIGSCNREQDIKAMRLAVALAGKPGFDQQDIVEGQVISPLEDFTFKRIKSALDAEPTLYIVSSDYQMQESLKTYLGPTSAKATFVDLDTAHSVKSASTCPFSLRTAQIGTSKPPASEPIIAEPVDKAP